MSSKSDTHIDSHGSGTVYKLARGAKDTPNPMTLDDYLRVQNYLFKELKPFPDWLSKEGNEFVSIGSGQSIFNQMRVFTGEDLIQHDHVDQIIRDLLERSD
jgi:hypothetical protein